ncbi:Uncharacterised protein [Mycobacteroides abscessus subsp. abscessus]|nr:Uncharacterised protein [Mycobacteroides abscessus subsp. abscessus]
MPSEGSAAHRVPAARAAASAASPSAAEAFRTCSAALAGLVSTAAPGYRFAISVSESTISASSVVSTVWVNPVLNSAP